MIRLHCTTHPTWLEFDVDCKGCTVSLHFVRHVSHNVQRTYSLPKLIGTKQWQVLSVAPHYCQCLAFDQWLWYMTASETSSSHMRHPSHQRQSYITGHSPLNTSRVGKVRNPRLCPGEKRAATGLLAPSAWHDHRPLCQMARFTLLLCGPNYQSHGISLCQLHSSMHGQKLMLHPFLYRRACASIL